LFSGGELVNVYFTPSEYYRPDSLGEAVALLSKYRKKARLIAGGTDLLVVKPSEVESLIDVSGLNLSYIKEEEGAICIGAATTVDLVENSSVLAGWPYQVLAEAAKSMATPTIRNMATIGGNVCNGSPAADLSLALMALDASVRLVGPKGSRSLPLTDFQVGVNRTVLEDDELLAEVLIPKSTGGASFLKLRRHQTAVDIAVVNVATKLNCVNGRCVDARIALGSVAEKQICARKAQSILVNQIVAAGVIQKAAEQAAEEAKPITDIRASAGYRKRMVAVLVRRSLEISAGRC
jgi:CO/xanthine dehydrogenase FAD-binding subunit